MSFMKFASIVASVAAMTFPATSSANYVYTPASSSPSYFISITLADSILHSLGNNLFSFDSNVFLGGGGGAYSEHQFGTLQLDSAGNVSSWNVEDDSGTRYYTYSHITRYDGATFFESAQQVAGNCCSSSWGPYLASAAGTWTVTSVPEPTSQSMMLLALVPFAIAGALRRSNSARNK